MAGQKTLRTAIKINNLGVAAALGSTNRLRAESGFCGAFVVFQIELLAQRTLDEEIVVLILFGWQVITIDKSVGMSSFVYLDRLKNK
ncbi:hypothetical protein [Chamaesiphon sp. VAR_69_metabat_338]|uniref:hypothetical protein n=1 Tax=Chamaesiphon sp. VAR_69_metabat_338 TaxID=2964704 RepID=UPI00286DA6E7|nr:hypothetical protein [Chamaesiphon sp. VAR_69_metabat_338]